MMKKAQMEMIGLVMIVVILGLVMAFFLAFAGSQADRELQHERFGESVTASNFVNSLVKVHVRECRPSRVDYGTLLKDCVSEGQITCGGIDSCRLANETAYEILEGTFDEWGVSYRFFIGEAGEEPLYNKTTPDCSEDDEKERPGINLLSLYPQEGEAEIKLEVCKT